MNEKPGGAIAASKKERRVRWPTIIVWSIVVVLVTVFVLQNTRSGNVDFLVWEIRAPKWAWIVGIFACGVLAGWLLRYLRRSRTGPN